MPDFRCIGTKCWAEMEVVCQVPYEGWQGGVVAPDQGNRALHVSDTEGEGISNSPTLSGPESQTDSDEERADTDTGHFKFVEKVTVDYGDAGTWDAGAVQKVSDEDGDAGTCDAGAVQKVSDVAPLVYVTVSPNMRLRSKTTLTRALRNCAALLT